MKYDPVKENQLLNELSLLNFSPKLLPEYERLKNLSEIIGKKIENIVSNDSQSIIIVFTDKTWLSIRFNANAYCDNCEDSIDDIDLNINLILNPSFEQLLNTNILHPEAIAKYSEIKAQLYQMNKLYNQEKEKSIEQKEREELARLKAKYENDKFI